MKIAFLGLGRMGQGMAHLLVKAGYQLNVYDVFPDAAKSLVEAGATYTPTIAEAVADRDFVITMLPSDPILEKVITSDDGLLKSLPQGATHVIMGTHGVEMVNKATKLHTDAGQNFVAAHVLGRPDLAASGQLTIVAAGPTEKVEALDPVFDVLGKKTYVAGTAPAASSAVKIANNFVLGCAIEVMGEAYALVSKLGGDKEMFHEVLINGLFGAPAYEVYGKMIATEAWDSLGATAVIGLKDINLALAAAESAKMPLPSAAVFRDRLLGAIAHGDENLDWCVAAREQLRASGLE